MVKGDGIRLNILILVRQLTKSHNGDLGPLRREHSMTSNYSNLVVEKELERRRKLREAKMRQESNPYNFNSGKIPRQAGGNINPQKAAEAYYNAKERDEGKWDIIFVTHLFKVTDPFQDQPLSGVLRTVHFTYDLVS